MKEVTIGTVPYRTQPLDVFVQFDLVRKLLPALVPFAKLRDQSAREDMTAVLGPIATALSTMSQEDSRFIIYACLGVVQKNIGNNQWAAVKATGANTLMEGDMSLATMMSLVKLVIEDNLANFFAVAEQLFPNLFGTTGSSP